MIRQVSDEEVERLAHGWQQKHYADAALIIKLASDVRREAHAVRSAAEQQPACVGDKNRLQYTPLGIPF
ncbi:MAG: hypothetical protein R3C56_03695 [Pirellulaceae bacterium]